MIAKHIIALWLVVAVVAAAAAVALLGVRDTQSHQNDALSAVICHAEHLVRKTDGLTRKQKQHTLSFYENQIKQEHLKPCSDR